MNRLDSQCHKDIYNFLECCRQQVHSLVNGLDSPLHCIFTNIFSENISAFNNILKRQGLQFQVLFAKKANKAQAFVEQCAIHNIGVDVASMQEFERVLAAGISGDKISVSGPHKHQRLLRLAQRHDALVAVDSLEELDDIVQMSTVEKTFRLLLRVKPESQSNSRFGMTSKEIDSALKRCCEYRHCVSIEGFSAHLRGYDLPSRVSMGHELIDWALKANREGLSCRMINIGGGFSVNYLHDKNWRESISATDFHADKSFSEFYPYYQDISGPDALERILINTTDERPFCIAHRLKKHHFTLLIEPGRALLDQAGITIFQAQGIKHMRHHCDDVESWSSATPIHHYFIATVAGMSFSLSEQWFNSEFIPSPLLLKKQEPVVKSVVKGQKKNTGLTQENNLTPYRVAIAGSSCLDDDMVSWRKIAFSERPEKGDMFVYVNTAGYQMDSNESEFHSIPLPRKVAISKKDSEYQWKLES